MARRPLFLTLFVALVGLVLSGAVLAQLESGDRGIAPLDSSGTLEITGIHVDVGGKDAQSARFAGWRIAQRQGFKALWAKTNGRPLSEAPNLPDSTLDGLVSSIIVEREQLGPTRYIADLGILFDRARAGGLLGVGGGEVRRSVPMLLIPIVVTGGTATTVELRTAWQRAWAEFRTNQSPLDYVRVSGMGIDPVLVNAAQTRRPGRGWWRNIVDFYGAADVLTAEVLLHRLYPGGPAHARFIGRHGPDNQIIGGFELRAADSAGIPAMMREGVQRMDALFAEALAAGRLKRDPTLDIPEPPPLPEEIEDSSTTAAVAQAYLFQVQIAASNVNTYNFAMAHLRTLPGIQQVTPVVINPSGTSYVTVSYQGSGPALASALAGRGWTTDAAGTIVRMSGGAGAPPPIPPPPPRPQPATPPATPPVTPPVTPPAEPQANATGQ